MRGGFGGCTGPRRLVGIQGLEPCLPGPKPGALDLYAISRGAPISPDCRVISSSIAADRGSGEEGNRTPDNPVAGRVLYLLSYIPIQCILPSGLEPSVPTGKGSRLAALPPPLGGALHPPVLSARRIAGTLDTAPRLRSDPKEDNPG